MLIRYYRQNGISIETSGSYNNAAVSPHTRGGRIDLHLDTNKFHWSTIDNLKLWYSNSKTAPFTSPAQTMRDANKDATHIIIWGN